MDDIEITQDEIDSIVMCCVCGLPDNACRLVRLSWQGEIKDDMTMELFCNADNPLPSDRFVCETCIRGIKRLPFGDIAKDQQVKSS